MWSQIGEGVFGWTTRTMRTGRLAHVRPARLVIALVLLSALQAPSASGEAPVTTATLSGSQSTGWFVSTVTVTFSSTLSGTTCYSGLPASGGGDGGAGDGGAGDGGGGGDGGDGGGGGGGGSGPCAPGETAYDPASPPLVQESGNFTLTYYTIPNVGEAEAPRSHSFGVDLSPPSALLALPSGHRSPFTVPSTSPCGSGGTANRLYSTGTVTVYLNGSGEAAGPGASGLAAASYQVHQGTTALAAVATSIPGTVVLSSEGNYTVRATATDKAGNVRTVIPRCVWIDRTAPTVTLNAFGPSSSGLSLVRVTSSEAIARAANDAGSAVTLSLTSPTGVASTLTLTSPVTFQAVREVWGAVALPEAGKWTLAASVPDEAGNSGAASATVTVTPGTDFAGLVSLAAAPQFACGSGVTCDHTPTVISAVLDPGSDAATALRLDVRHASASGVESSGTESPTAERTDSAGRVHAWWNATRGPGALAYRLLVDRASGVTEASAWRGVVVRDMTPPSIPALFPGSGAEFRTGLLGEITGSWSDSSGVDASSLVLELDRQDGATLVSETTLAALASKDASGFRYAPASGFAKGNYTLRATVKDQMGNSVTATSSFVVKDAAASSSSSSSSGSSGGGSSTGGDCVGEAPGQGASGSECNGAGGSSGGTSGATGGATGSSGSGGSTTPPPAAEADATPPRVDAYGPTGVVRDSTAPLTASWSDPSGVVPGSVIVELDGVRLAANATATGVRVAPPAPLEPGVHRVALRVDDVAGNSRRVEWSFLLVPPPVPGERSVVHAATAAAGATLELVTNDPALFIDGLEFRPREASRNVTLTVLHLRELPASVTPTPVPPLTLLDVTLRAEAGTPDVVGRYLLRFSVPHAALAAAGANSSQVLGMRFTNGEWTLLDGGVESQNATHARFAYRTEGFSPFALVTDTRAPSVTPASPEEGALLRGMPTVVAKLADDVRVVSASALVDHQVIADVAEPGNLLSAVMPALADGRHLVEVRAADAAGNVERRSWTFILDREGPTFPRAGPDGLVTDVSRARVEVAFADGVSGVDVATVRARFDGADVTPKVIVREDGVLLGPDVALSPGLHRFEVTVSDRAGNSATHVLSFEVATSDVPLPPVAFVLAALALAAFVRRR